MILSIDGRKFAGISQRRLRQGIAVQVYLCIEGSGAERAELIRELYKVGVKAKQQSLSIQQLNQKLWHHFPNCLISN